MVRAFRRFVLATWLASLVIAAPAGAATRDVLLVGNNWDGTADIIDPERFERIGRLDIIPDREQRLAEIQADPAAYGYFVGIRQLIGEGHDQFVDDMFTSPDGRFVYVSRPSFADVVGIEMATGKIAWRVKVDGYRADHMAISPDGSRLLVSASTAKLVDVIDPRVGQLVGRFPSGDQPHENTYSRDGKLIYHASIGTVFTPADDPLLDATKGERYFQVVDADSLQVLRRINMGQKLAEAGYPNMSAAVRPMALAPDERKVYFQVSFFHGFVEYDLVEDRVLRLAHLPLSQEAAAMRRDEYVLDSAHHGLTMNPEGTKLCAAGTMSDYAAIVSRTTFSHRIINVGEKPYWATNSGDGRYCFVSVSGDDRVSVISYETEEEVARIPVGDHPQRMRMGKLAVPAAPDPAPGR
jgi:YVTN family beta-propeller protein